MPTNVGPGDDGHLATEQGHVPPADDTPADEQEGAFVPQRCVVQRTGPLMVTLLIQVCMHTSGVAIRSGKSM